MTGWARGRVSESHTHSPSTKKCFQRINIVVVVVVVVISTSTDDDIIRNLKDSLERIARGLGARHHQISPRPIRSAIRDHSHLAKQLIVLWNKPSDFGWRE